MNKGQVIEAPKDVGLQGAMLSVKKATWEEILNPEQLEKFKEESRKEERVLIEYEVHFQGRGVFGKENYPYHESPSSNSLLGKFLIKYTDLKAGQEIKVIYNSEGIGRILLE